MRHIFKYIAWIVIASCVVSCSGIPDMVEVMVEEVTSDKNSVSLNVVDRYITAVKGLPRTRADQTEITPVLNGNDTVMYLVNYPEGGWELLSADKRVPTRLMVGEEGSMSLSEIENHPGMSILLNDMRNQISAVKRSSQEEPVTEKGILWDDIAPMTENTRSENINWVLYDTETVYLDSTDIRHLTKTHWGQTSANGKWYNRFVPYVDSSKQNTSEGRCAVGCVPVAIGQMLAYLYGKINLTTTCTFSECTCNTFVPEGVFATTYGDSFIPNVSTSMSNDMYWRNVAMGSSELQQKCIAVLLSYLGYLLDSVYYIKDPITLVYSKFTNTQSSLIMSCLNNIYNIYCNDVAWNSAIVKAQLTENKMPVLIFANDQNGDKGHTWIIDGYYCMNSLINYYYVGFEQPSTSEPIYKTVQLAQNEEFFTMNWGEGGIGDADTYYIDSSDWTIDSQHYFVTNRRIMYGFSN